MRILFFLLLLFGNLSGAAPLTHLHLSDLLCEKWGIEGAERELFLKGSVFPDICYFTESEMKKLHFSDITTEQILNEEDLFKKGMLYHSFVDEERERILQELDICSLVTPVSPDFPDLLLQAVEDEILYDRCASCLYPLLFIFTLDQEREVGFSDIELEEWNKAVFFYLSMRPSTLMRLQAVTGKSLMGVSAEELRVWSREIPRLAKRPKVREYVEFLTTTCQAALLD